MQREKVIGGVTGKGWLPGQSGNPGGRPKRKYISEALRDALEGGDANKLADVLIKLGRKGVVAAIREVADRTEGRATETVQISGTITHEYINPESLSDEQLAQADALIESACAGSDPR